MLRAISVSSNVWEVNFNFRSSTELFLSLFCLILDALHSGSITAKVDAGITLEAVEDIINNLVVEVFATKVGIAVCGLYFEDAVAEFEDGNIESTATKVEDNNLLVFVLFETISKSGCGRLVNNTANFEAGNLTSILRSLALRIVEVSRNCNDSFSHSLAEEGLCVCLNLRKNHSGNFFWSIFFAAEFNRDASTLLYDLVWGVLLVVLNFFVVKFATNETLDTIDSILWVSDALALRNLTDEAVTLLRDSYNGRGRTIAFAVCDNFWFACDHIGECRVGRTEVNTDNLTHIIPPFWNLFSFSTHGGLVLILKSIVVH